MTTVQPLAGITHCIRCRRDTPPCGFTRLVVDVLATPYGQVCADCDTAERLRREWEQPVRVGAD